jgi:hypothetical protein
MLLVGVKLPETDIDNHDPWNEIIVNAEALRSRLGLDIIKK